MVGLDTLTKQFCILGIDSSGRVVMVFDQTNDLNVAKMRLKVIKFSVASGMENDYVDNVVLVDRGIKEG